MDRETRQGRVCWHICRARVGSKATGSQDPLGRTSCGHIQAGPWPPPSSPAAGLPFHKVATSPRDPLPVAPQAHPYLGTLAPSTE